MALRYLQLQRMPAQKALHHDCGINWVHTWRSQMCSRGAVFPEEALHPRCLPACFEHALYCRNRCHRCTDACPAEGPPPGRLVLGGTTASQLAHLLRKDIPALEEQPGCCWRVVLDSHQLRVWVAGSFSRTSGRQRGTPSRQASFEGHMGLLSRPDSFRKDAPAAEDVSAPSRILYSHSSSFRFALCLDAPASTYHILWPKVEESIQAA